MLPGDFPPWPTLYYHFRRFRLGGLWHRAFAILPAAERKRVGKNPDVSVAIVDSQSMKTTEEGAGSTGYDVRKNIKGLKSDTCWWTPWGYRFRSISPPPTYRTVPERASYSLDWDR